MDERGHLHLADFGLSKQVSSWDDRMKTFCGTPYYLAPEIITQCRGAGATPPGPVSSHLDFLCLSSTSCQHDLVPARCG